MRINKQHLGKQHGSSSSAPWQERKAVMQNGIQEDQHRTILFLHKCLLRTVRLLVIASIPLHLLFKESSGLNDTSGEAESKCTEYRNIPPNHLIVSVIGQMVSGKAIIEKKCCFCFPGCATGRFMFVYGLDWLQNYHSNCYTIISCKH